MAKRVRHWKDWQGNVYLLGFAMPKYRKHGKYYKLVTYLGQYRHEWHVYFNKH